MGRDKALLDWNSHTLVEDVAEKVRSVAGNVALVGPVERYRALELACMPDSRPGLGPLAGIEAAIESGRGNINLIAACDLPGLRTAWLRGLLQRAETAEARCVLLRDAEGRVQPLCGIYRKECLPVIRRALDEHRLRMREMAEELKASFFDVAGVLTNLNTPEDVTAWRRMSVAGDG
jgi:molybdopterin-guanine dinucleotide biosynthesis protein A